MKTVADFKAKYADMVLGRSLKSISFPTMNDSTKTYLEEAQAHWNLDRIILAMQGYSARPDSSLYYPGWFEVEPKGSPQSAIRSMVCILKARKMSVGPVGVMYVQWVNDGGHLEPLPFIYFYEEADAVAYRLVRDE